MSRYFLTAIFLIKIVFAGAQISEPDSIFRINMPGSDELYPSWSDDGKSIVFQSNKNKNRDIFKYDFTNDTLIQITTDSTDQQHPVFIPGKDNEIVFDENSGENSVLIKMNLKTLKKELLIKTKSVNGSEASFSPSGRLVAFKGFDKNTNNFQVFTYDFVYDNLNRLTDYKDFEIFSPRFSPDGKLILFGLKNKYYPFEEHLAEVSWYGDEVTKLDSLHDAGFCWSNNGFRIICLEYKPSGSSVLVSERKNGKSKFVLIDDKYNKTTPAISPSEPKMAISIDYAGDYDIVIMKLDD